MSTSKQVTRATLLFDRRLHELDCAAWSNYCISFGAQISFENVDLYTYVIKHDIDHMGPRIENENLGVMHCVHKRYNLGDKNADTPFVDNDYCAGVLRKDVLLSLPIYLYDHGGITISHKSFNCNFDSGLLGWHYMTRTVAEANWPSLTGKQLTEAVERCLEAELETYDQYLQGDVYGFQILDVDGDEFEASWGYIGNDIETNGMLDNADRHHHDGLRAAWEKRCY